MYENLFRWMRKYFEVNTNFSRYFWKSKRFPFPLLGNELEFCSQILKCETMENDLCALLIMLVYGIIHRHPLISNIECYDAERSMSQE